MSTTTTTTNPAKPTYHAAILLFPQADILDYAGPLEVLTHALHNRNPEAPEPIFTIDTVARDGLPPTISTGKSNLVVQPSKTVTQVLAEIERYDVLIIPGGPPNVVQGLLKPGEGEGDGKGQQELELVKAFMAMEPHQQTSKERVLMSVCTGAFLLAAAGCLAGVQATTHHRALDTLQQMCGPTTTVLAGRRFVDAGLVRPGLRVVTSGGVSSGIEAAFHLVGCFTDEETVAFVSRVMEFERRPAWTGEE